MQLSNDNYIYQCGLDILNNHLIRSKTFKTVCKCYNSDIGSKAEENYSDYTAFNTIAALRLIRFCYRIRDFRIIRGCYFRLLFLFSFCHKYISEIAYSFAKLISINAAGCKNSFFPVFSFDLPPIHKVRVNIRFYLFP